MQREDNDEAILLGMAPSIRDGDNSGEFTTPSRQIVPWNRDSYFQESAILQLPPPSPQKFLEWQQWGVVIPQGAYLPYPEGMELVEAGSQQWHLEVPQVTTGGPLQ